MDDTNLKQNEEEMSLDDMMAGSLKDEAATSESNEEPSETVVDEIQDSPEAPKEESDVVDPAPNIERQRTVSATKTQKVTPWP